MIYQDYAACGLKEEGVPPTLVKALMAWARMASSTSAGIVCRLTMQCNTQRIVWCWPYFCRNQNKKSCLKNTSRNKLRAATEPGTGWRPSTQNLQYYIIYQGLTNVYNYVFEKLSRDKIKAC